MFGYAPVPGRRGSREDSKTERREHPKSLCRFRPKVISHKNTNASASKNNNGLIRTVITKVIWKRENLQSFGAIESPFGSWVFYPQKMCSKSITRSKTEIRKERKFSNRAQSHPKDNLAEGVPKLRRAWQHQKTSPKTRTDVV